MKVAFPYAYTHARNVYDKKMKDASKTIKFVTIVGMLLNILLAVAKFVAGVLSSCQALIADAVHSTSDLVTDLAVIAGVKYWSQPPDKGHPYGHARIETMVTALIGLMLILVGIGIGLDSIEQLIKWHPKENSARWVTFSIALASIILKEWLYRWTVVHSKVVKSPALEANAWHHRTDAISSVPVAISILITLIFPSLWFVDQIGAIIVSLFILHAAWEIIKPNLDELTDCGMDAEFYESVKATAYNVPCVSAVHAVRARRLGNTMLLDLHILVDGQKTVFEGHKIAHSVRDALVALPNYNITDVIVHVEPFIPDELRKDSDPQK